MMTDQDVIILSHGGCNLQSGDAMWTLSHVSSWDVGTDVMMSALSVTSSLFDEMKRQINMNMTQYR